MTAGHRLYGPGPGEPRPLLATRDLSGLAVADIGERPIGELYGTLADEDSGLIRYLDISLTLDDRHVLVPIGHTRIMRDSIPPKVRLRTVSYEDLQTIPEYEPETMPAPAYQSELIAAFSRIFSGERYYAHPAFDHARLYAGEHPVVADDEPEDRRVLGSLAQLDGYRLKAGAADIRGWRVIDRSGNVAGSIHDLVVDIQARKVRYLDILLHQMRRRTLLPVGYAQIDAPALCVRTPALEVEDLSVLPEYQGEDITREDENRLRVALEGRLVGPRYFDRPDFYI